MIEKIQISNTEADLRVLQSKVTNKIWVDENTDSMNTKNERSFNGGCFMSQYFVH